MAGPSFDMMQGRDLLDDLEDDNAPLLTAEEEMHHQRALWINRLLKEQVAAQTHGMSIKEIEGAQAVIQARMREAQRLDGWPMSSSLRAAGQRISARSSWSNASPRRTPSVRSHSEVN